MKRPVSNFTADWEKYCDWLETELQGEQVVSTAITAYDPDNEWVSINDKMPPSNSSVMLYSQNSGVVEGEYDNKKDRYIAYRWNGNIKTTHWKELPEPPYDKDKLLKDLSRPFSITRTGKSNIPSQTSCKICGSEPSILYHTANGHFCSNCITFN